MQHLAWFLLALLAAFLLGLRVGAWVQRREIERVLGYPLEKHSLEDK